MPIYSRRFHWNLKLRGLKEKCFQGLEKCRFDCWYQSFSVSQALVNYQQENGLSLIVFTSVCRNSTKNASSSSETKYPRQYITLTIRKNVTSIMQPGKCKRNVWKNKCRISFQICILIKKTNTKHADSSLVSTAVKTWLVGWWRYYTRL